MTIWQTEPVVDSQSPEPGRSADANAALLPILIYDGDCAFCSSSVRFIERRIRRHPTCQPWQWLDLAAYGVTQEDCESAVQFVDEKGRVHSAEAGIARVLITGGRGWAVIGRVMLVPGIRRVAALAYKWIAKNRHRMPGGTAQCSLPAAQRQHNSGKTT